MAVPSFEKFLLPVLQHTADGEPHRPADSLAHALSELKLSEADVSERLLNGRTRVMDRTLWAITYLRKSKLIESVSFGVFRITDRGQQLLAEKPKILTQKSLERFPEFLDFKGRGKAEIEKDESKQAQLPLTETPEEQLDIAYRALRSALEAELLDRIKAATPVFFEKLVVNLIVAMGYGGTLIDAGKATKQSGDDGIDGVVKEDRLGFDLIHIQAKRWLTQTVGRPEIQSFAGSLEGQRGRKGVFITTSSFSAEAQEYVSRIEKKIVLIDGQQLTRLCVDFGIGVSDQTKYIVKKLDQDFFEDA